METVTNASTVLSLRPLLVFRSEQPIYREVVISVPPIVHFHIQLVPDLKQCNLKNHFEIVTPLE